jgi:hypothetical protein
MKAKAAYARLRVVAAKRRSAAEDVEVLILGGRELTPRQGYPPNADDIALMGQLLRWSNVEPTLTHLTIPPGARKHIDLVVVVRAWTAAGLAPAQIEVYPYPYDDRHRIKSGSFELELAVMARNADARRYRVVVNYDGEWGDDIWTHLIVETPELLRDARSLAWLRP